MSEQSVYQKKYPPYTFTVYGNRVEIDERRGCLAMMRPRREVIPFRSIASVEVTSLNALVIATNDGHQHVFRILGAREVSEAILRGM